MFDDTLDIVADKRTVVDSQETRLEANQVLDYVDKFCSFFSNCSQSSENAVVLFLDRNVYVPVMVFSLFKIGKPFLLIDKNLPPDKIERMLASVHCDLIVTDCPDLSGEAVVPLASVLTYSANKPVKHIGAETGYYFFTSGTTGVPKCIAAYRASLVNRIHWMINEFSLTENDVFIHKTRYSFDPCIWEMLTPFFLGARLTVLPNNMDSDLLSLHNQLKKNGVTIVHFTPTMLHLFDKYTVLAALPHLRYLLCGGEKWDMELARRVLKKTDAALYNGYGPSETTISVLFHRVTGHEKRLPLGKPIDNVILKIIDIDTGEPIQQGTGLLHIGGAAVAKGYTNVNSDNFYSEIVQGDKIRFYNSGDVVRIDDGDIYFKGRLDNQIKIGGVRIELEEIERTVSALYGVDDCVAIFDKGIQCFCSGLMPLSTEEMKHELTRALPAVFIPKKISKVDSIKLLSNGKVDRMHYEQMC